MLTLACAAFVVEACATATQEDLLKRGDDDDEGGGSGGTFPSGGTSGTGFGAAGFGGSSGVTGQGGATGGTSPGQGGSTAQGGTAGTGAGAAGEAGTGDGGAAPDPCVYTGTLPDLRVEFKHDGKPVTDDPGGEFHVVNGTNDSVELSELEVRYWLRSEFSCEATLSNMNVNITFFQLQSPFEDVGGANVLTDVIEVIPDGTGCEVYFSLGFTEDAGSLIPTQYAAIGVWTQIPIYTSAHNQSNDWSFGACRTMHVYWDRITLYRDGSLVSGREPGGGGGGGGGGEGGAAGAAGQGGAP